MPQVLPARYDWSGMHAFKDSTGEIIAEMGGYDITIRPDKRNFSLESLAGEIRPQYNPLDILAEYRETSLEVDNLVIETETIINERYSIVLSHVYYLIEFSPGNILQIHFETFNPRDAFFEIHFVSLYLAGEIEEYFLTNRHEKTFSFAGKEFKMPGSSYWERPHNLVFEDGQLIWSEFSTRAEAETDNEILILYNELKKEWEIKLQEEVEVEIDNKPSLAYRVVYETAGTGKNSVLLDVYYVVEKLRGKYVSGMFINHGLNTRYPYLSSYLQELMNFPGFGKNAFNRSLLPPLKEEKDIPEEERIDLDYFSIYHFYFSYCYALGGSGKLFTNSPSVGFDIGFPITANLAIDLGLYLTFPVNSKNFDYYAKTTVYDVKLQMSGGLNLRLRHEKRLKPNVYFSKYAGIGISINQTDLLESAGEDYDSYYSINTIDLLAGARIRYRYFGVFTEAHFTPYTLTDKIRESVADKYLYLGLFFAL